MAGQTVTGAQVVERLVQIIFDPTYAQAVGMTDRHGNTTATWPDGTTRSRVTGFTLLRDALDGIDKTFAAADATAAQARWQRARRLFLDQFFAVDASNHFVNPATVPLLLRLGLRVLREQVNAQCPDRETTGQCAWGQTGLGDEWRQALSGPWTAAALDLLGVVGADESLRRAVEGFIKQALSGDAPLLSWIGDWIQAESDDADLVPQRQAISVAFTPGGAVRSGVHALAWMLSRDTDGLGPIVVQALLGRSSASDPAPAIDRLAAALLSVQRVAPGAADPPSASDLKAVAANQSSYWSGPTPDWVTLTHLLQRHGVQP